MKPTVSERIFNIAIYIFFVAFCILMLVPVLYVLKKSFDVGSSGELSLSLIPKQFSLFYYRIILNDKGIYRPFLNSAFITVVGTALSIFLESMGAYTLSKRDLPGNKIFIYMIIIPMMFGGGLIPYYLLIKYLGLMNKIAVLIIPACISGWNMLLIRNYYFSIPPSLSESAMIDGAQEFTIFWKIILPLSTPVLAAISLFTAVGYWNTFFSAILFINDPKKYTFPVKLREMIIVQQEMQRQIESMLIQTGEDTIRKSLNTEGISSAMIIISMLPIILIYPYLQKHFAKGIMIGSIKG